MLVARQVLFSGHSALFRQLHVVGDVVVVSVFDLTISLLCFLII